MSSILQPGKKQAEKAAKKQEEAIAGQRQKEELALAETESGLARRRAVASKGGRKSLIATSQAGVSSNLGGT